MKLPGAAALLFLSQMCAAGPPMPRVGGPQVNPLQFRVTRFASGLNFPYSMQVMDDGALLVGTTRFPSGATDFFASTVGEIVRLVDADHDGIADGPGTVVYTGLPGVVTSLRRAGALLLISSSLNGSEGISVLRPGPVYSLVGKIQFSFPANWEHKSYTLAVGAVAGQTDTYTVYFNVGSFDNYSVTTQPVGVSGLLTGSLNGDSIYAFTLSNTLGNPSFSNLRKIAAGLRNAAGILVHPSTGDLYFTDNGIDSLIDVSDQLSADEINRIPAAQIATNNTGPVADFGYPFDYVTYRTGVVTQGTKTQPLVVFQPLTDAFTGIGSESEGPAEIAFAPAGFPAGLNNGIFVGIHGRGSAGMKNEENPLVYYDFASGKYFHFIDNDQPVGHLDSLLSTNDALFAADFSPNGPLDLTSAGTGVIYMIQALAQPRPSDGPGPSSVSLSPNAGTGSTQTFQFVYSHPAGYAQIAGAKVLIGATSNAANACLLYYEQTTNTLLLADDPVRNWQGPITLGQPGSLQNSQCALDGGASSVSGAGNNLTVNLALTFKSTFPGQKNVYTWVMDNIGLVADWQLRGAWSVPNAAPSADSVTPSSGAGAVQTFSFSYSDANGSQDLSLVYALFNSGLNGANACFLAYVPGANLLYLINDAGNAVLPPITPGAGSVQNSQCALNGIGSTVAKTAGSLTVNVPIAFQPALAGLKTVYLLAVDAGGLTSGWQARGTWTGVSDSAPTVLSVNPSSGAGASQTFQFAFTDANFFTDLALTYMLFNSGLNGANGCFIAFNRPVNGLYLVNDAGTATAGPITPGAAGALSNSQCTLSSGGLPVGSGVQLTIPIALSFQPTFLGIKNIYALALDLAGLHSGWQQVGTWSAMANRAPIAVSVMPNNGSGASATFTLTYSDADGASDLAVVYMLAGSVLDGAGACFLAYNRPVNLLYLVNNAGNGLVAGALTPGSAGVLSNSQCTIASPNAAVASGNTLSLAITVQFQSSFAGPKNVYLLATDTAGAISNWQPLGTWTVQ